MVLIAEMIATRAAFQCSGFLSFLTPPISPEAGKKNIL
jgi:hypothetical protein